jgi:hypothetical protein
MDCNCHCEYLVLQTRGNLYFKNMGRKSKYADKTGFDGLSERVEEGRRNILTGEKLIAYDAWRSGKGPMPDFLKDNLTEQKKQIGGPEREEH